MTLLELRNRRNKLMADAALIVRNEVVTTEHRASFDRMMADVDILEADIARLERVAQFDSEQRDAGRPPRPQPGLEVRGEERTELEKKAFAQYVRYGKVSAENAAYLHAGESRDLGTVTAGSITAGSQLVPQGFLYELLVAQRAWGAITTIVKTRKTDNGAPMRIALMNDTGNELSVLGEDTAVTETDPSFSGITLNTDFCSTGVVKVSLAELQDSAFSIEDFLRDSFGKRYYRGVSALITNGSSTGNVQAITAGAPVTTAATGNSTIFDYASIAKLYGALDPGYVQNASWSMNSTTRATLLGVTDSLGRPLYIPSPSADVFDTLIGRPVVLNQFLPSIGANNKSIMFGDFNAGYLFRQVGDFQIVRLNERYLDSGMIGFILFARVGGVVTDAGTHPLQILQNSAS
jgi:HK97 family phage major capsid protein